MSGVGFFIASPRTLYDKRKTTHIHPKKVALRTQAYSSQAIGSRACVLPLGPEIDIKHHFVSSKITPRFNPLSRRKDRIVSDEWFILLSLLAADSVVI